MSESVWSTPSTTRTRRRLQEALEKLEDDREGGVEQSDENREALQRSEAEVEQIDNEISELQSQIKLLSEERKQLDDERKDAARQKAKLELDVQSTLDTQTSAQQARTQHANDLRDVQEQISGREAELTELMPEYTAKKEQERALRQQITDTEGAINRLYAKQGRQNQFKTKRERDDYLRKEIADVNVTLATRKAITMQTQEDIAELESQIGQLEAEITDMRSRIENRGDDQQRIATDVTRAKEERDRLNDQRKELWREEAKLDSVIENAKAELDKAEKFLSHMMDQSTSRGLQAVRRIVRDNEIEGAYGTLGELFEFNDKYKTAVEVTAGTSLFNYVVDTDDTATRITEILQKEKAGRVTFVPLNRVKVKPVNIPKTSDAVHLVTKLRYDPMYEAAFQQVFGKTIVCPNIQIASQYARSHQVTAITPDGDRSDKKGALTGGYYDTRSSRTDGMKRQKRAREEWEQHAGRKREIQGELDRIAQLVTKAMSELQKIEQRRVQLEGGYGPLRDELRRREGELHGRRDELERKVSQRENVEGMVRTLGEQMGQFQRELAGDFKKALSNDEERQLEGWSEELPELRKQVGAISRERSELEGRKGMLEGELRDNLRLRLDQLLNEEAEGGEVGGGGAGRLKEMQRELKRAGKSLDAIQSKLNENEAAIDEAQQTLHDHRDLPHQQSQADRGPDPLTPQPPKDPRERRPEARSAHPPPRGRRHRNPQPRRPPRRRFHARVRSTGRQRRDSALHKAQEALKKYGHVNKKAFEQFAQFERQREALEGRQEGAGKERWEYSGAD